MEDAERVLPQLRAVNYHQPEKVLGGLVEYEFYDAGHILGSAFELLKISDEGSEKKLLFSGDLGRDNMPILRDPEQAPEADFLILESTYGNRLHDDYAIAEEDLASNIERVIARGGKVVIPAFSVGRTQEIVYALNNLWNRGRLQRVPIYVDSPLSVNATEIFRNHPECYDDEVKHVFLTDPDPFGFDSLIYVHDVATSKRINELKSPCIIISASGMAEAGRVLHHLANNVSDPRNAILIVGFQAENTLGRKLVERQPEVRILGDSYPLKEEVIVFNAFSAHADSAGLRKFASQAAASGRLKKIFLVHGEESVALEFQKTLQQDLPKCEILVPRRGERFTL
jgi:metallo-beta-lactamase family protein